MNGLSNFSTKESNLKPIYRIGAFAALTAVILFRRYISAEMMASNGFGIFEVPQTTPVTAIGWFNLLQKNRFVGLVLLDVFDLVNYALVALIFLALYAVLKKTNQVTTGVATLFCLVGVAVHFASNQSFSILYLSDQYAAATSETQRSIYISAGEALLADFHGTGIHISLFLVLLAGLITSLTMFNTEIFNKMTAISGIIANSFGLTYFIVIVSAPEISWLPPTISAPFRMLWYVLIAVKLFDLAKGEK